MAVRLSQTDFMGKLATLGAFFFRLSHSVRWLVHNVGLEEEARKARRGLWSMPNPVPPWEFRRQGRK